MYLFGGNSPLRTVFITDARPLYFLYVTRVRASDRIVSEKKAFLSDSILTSGIGNKKEGIYCFQCDTRRKVAKDSTKIWISRSQEGDKGHIRISWQLMQIILNLFLEWSKWIKQKDKEFKIFNTLRLTIMLSIW